MKRVTVFFLYSLLFFYSCKTNSPISPENDAPRKPANPSPFNCAVSVPLNSSISWDCSDPNNDSLFYNIFFGTDSIPQLVKRGHPDTTYSGLHLTAETKYYWKIIVSDSYGAIDSSDLWNFTTGAIKSQKRGIAFDLSSAADFTAISKGISWWYNWGPICNTKTPSSYYQTYGMDFIPMLWGGNTSANDMTLIKSFILNHSEIQYLLVMNEPNLTDQANRTPSQAAANWIKYEQVISDLATKGRTVYLVGPAMSWGTMTNYSNPVTWLDAFYNAYKTANNGKEPRIDFLAFHWYDYGLAAQLDALKKYNKKIWVTEMANWNSQINSYSKQAVQMQQMVATCESRDDVFRYAWFYGRGSFPDNKFTYLFTPNDGELSDLGKLYISLPY